MFIYGTFLSNPFTFFFSPTMSSPHPMAVLLTTHEMHKVYGYCIVGLILCLTGAALLTAASVQRQFLDLPDDFQDPQKLRSLLQDDRKHDAIFNAGISILTSGLLLLFGFGVTEFTAGALTSSEKLRT